VLEDKEYRKFVQTVIDNIKKNGFPQKKVSFPLEQMYEVAEKNNVSFNKVLETLNSIQIDHEKTPDKIIFFPKKVDPAESSSKIKNTPLMPDIDPSMFKDMDLSQLASTAANMMKNMNPKQLENIKDMYSNMSDEQRAEIIERAKKFGLF